MSLFALLLICVVGVALILASGTDSALTGNYRSATSVYYAALAGLEEGRGRMLLKSPNYLPTALALPAGSAPAVGQVWYIINQSPSDPPIVPLDPASAYADTEYAQEFPTAPSSVLSTPSVSPVPALSLPGPIYKWVRINAITEQSLNRDINGDGILGTNALFYDGVV